MVSVFKEFKKRIKLQVLPYVITFVVSTDVEASRVMRNLFLGEYKADENTVALHSYCEGESYIFLPWNAGLGLIVHEAYHCVWQMMSHVGADHEDEIVAYHLSFLCKEATKLLEKHHDEFKAFLEEHDVDKLSEGVIH